MHPKFFSGLAWFLILVTHPPRVAIPSTTSVIAVCVTELAALHVIEPRRNIDFRGNNPQSWEREEKCVLLFASKCLCVTKTQNVSIPVQAASLLPLLLLLTVTNVIKPADGQDTRGNDPGFNWLQLILLNKKGRGYASYLTCLYSLLMSSSELFIRGRNAVGTAEWKEKNAVCFVNQLVSL